MTDDFRTGASWGAMRAELAGQFENHMPGDYTLPVLEALMDAVENHVPPQYRGEVVDAALDAWQEAADRHENR